MRVLTFSTRFPSYHPRKGEPTLFVEKIWKSFVDEKWSLPMDWGRLYVDAYTRLQAPQKPIDLLSDYLAVDPKFHTIRAGKRWKVGDWFKPRIWTGRPYNSPQFQFAPPIEVKKTWDFVQDECGVIAINGFYDYSEFVASDEFFPTLAKNDGLSEIDLHFWLPPAGKRFEGQIICWNDKIEY